MNILGIETSCDETAAAVVADGRRVLSNVINSQVELHGPYGGVVPEIASRAHVEFIPAVVDEAVEGAGTGWNDINGIAFTYGPGLSSSLLIGISTAKGLAMRLGLPLYGINHIEAHIYSVFLDDCPLEFEEACPFTALVVSGGHTSLFRVEGIGKYRLLGQTIDDAAGEAFDKGANLLGLGYPGGPVIDRVARDGDPAAISFPRGAPKKMNERFFGMDPNLCFSFSGLKTSLMYYMKENRVDDAALPSVAASYQEAIVDALVTRCERGIEKGDRYFAVGGGVSLNGRLRDKLGVMAKKRGVELLLAKPVYCGDNAAMIAGLAGAGQGITGAAAMDIDAEPNLPLGLESGVEN